ncbi:hypothetical protein HYALB_00013868 [Hymenoscyphus albidus]|uniref:Uncharacterized protein n=1 Tax=Hymenoscyphus albidus TaxID=595503 RepID=A0A9N9LWV9_9HELO|nr:hypothetical protein HYALB_00013868 [Hymenoscyphus albidus]
MQLFTIAITFFVAAVLAEDKNGKFDTGKCFTSNDKGEEGYALQLTKNACDEYAANKQCADCVFREFVTGSSFCDSIDSNIDAGTWSDLCFKQGASSSKAA